MEVAAAENVSITRIAQPSRVVSRPTCRRTFKVIVLGDPNVGKTCLSFRFCNGKFPSNTEATIGVDFREKIVELEGEILRVQFWDTAGQERFRQSMVSHYYRNVHAIIFVYDVSQASSFRQLPHWIVGNKCDIPTVQVSTEEAQRFADQHDMPLFITSAKDEAEADQITSIYMTLVHILQKNKPVHVTTDEERVRLKAHLEEQSTDYCGC